MASSVRSQRPPHRTRADWLELIKPLHESGKSQNEIARALGLSRSFVQSVIVDPTGERERERKRRYQGVCVDCKGPTHGGDGRGEKASTRCAECARIYNMDQKYWTRERVIEAIQKFARENGRPPNANDWNNSKRHRNGYPYTNSVYNARHAPFSSWAEAIEAAGFPRPEIGKYPRTDAWRLRVSRRMRVWSKAKIIAALQEWAEANGRPPTSTEWRPTAPDRPTSQTVTRWFGSWRAALKAAGLR